MTAQHYTALAISTLQAAVETIRLDLSAGEVIALPMRAVGGADPVPKAAAHGADFGAGLGAGRTKREGESPMISLARPAGLEPATRGLEGRCSIQLSYRRSLASYSNALRAR
jgi:hypothetical protein